MRNGNGGLHYSKRGVLTFLMDRCFVSSHLQIQMPAEGTSSIKFLDKDGKVQKTISGT